MLTLLYKRCISRGAKLPASWLLAVYLVIGIMQLHAYFAWHNTFFILCVVAMVMVFRIDRTCVGSMRCGWVAMFFLLLSWQLPVFTLRYAALASAIFFVVEYFYGRIHLLTFITAILVTPAIDYAANVFSFPLRLWLTGMAGKMLAGVNPSITINGNVIQLGHNEFTVDVACMGLQMMLTSLLWGVMLIAFYQRRYQKTLPGILVGLVLTGIIGLNIIANLFRIILLVQFALPPDTAAHDAVGILSLLIYVILPLIPGIKWLLQRYGKAAMERTFAAPHRYGLVLQLLLLLGIVAGYYLKRNNAGSDMDSNSRVKTLPGYLQTIEADHVVKQTAADALLYIKPIPGFYFTDHQPMICWKGSGFEFFNVKEQTMQGVKMYTAELRKGNSTLYTAWWYENSTRRSSSQLEWRWDALCSGDNYYLINMTVEKKTLLEQKIGVLLHTHLIQ
ncbi:exosortase N [Chitinophaga sp. RAB17]|uniref:exosortase N n=1 Tax=Chitinophaga sp. RAB17 TaxID=3233049 RepID=UPI003F91E54E